MDIRIVSTIISAIVGVFVPLSIWYLNKKNKNQEIEDLEKQIKRLDLIERISEMSDDMDIDVKYLIKGELQKAIDILHPVNEEEEIESTKNNNLEYDLLPKWRKIFLIFKGRNSKIILLQIVFFYIIYSLGANVGELIFGNSIDQLIQEKTKDNSNFGIVIYVVFALMFSLQIALIKVLHFYATKFQRG